MKGCILSIMLAVMFLPTAVLGQEPGRQELEFQTEMRERETQMQNREAEMDFHRKMQELELEKNRIELEHLRRAEEPPEHAKHFQKDKLHPLLLLVIVVHILAAVWVYQDIRRRGRGSGIWIVIAILTGLLGTLVYAVVRLGDSEEKKA